MLMKCIEYKYGQSYIENKNILEWGCGTGAVGIAMAALGGNVVLTDQESILFLTKENCQYAQQHLKKNHLVVKSYNWGETFDISEIEFPINSIDVILISDCLLPKLYPMEPLIQSIDILSSSISLILMSYEHRFYQNFDPKIEFFKKMKQKGFTIRILQEDELHPFYQADDIEIWEIKRQIL